MTQGINSVWHLLGLVWALLGGLGVGEQMTHSLGREQLSDYWYNELKQEYSLGSATQAHCKIVGIDHTGEILPSDGFSYYLPNKLYYARDRPSVRDVSDRFKSDGIESFDLSSTEFLKAVISEPIGHVKIKIVESNCLYLLAFLSSEAEINLEYVSLSQDIRIARSSTKIFENPNQSLFRADLEFPNDNFLSLHQPTSVHKNLHVLCVGFTEISGKLKVDIDFAKKVEQSEPQPNENETEAPGSNETTGQEDTPTSTNEEANQDSTDANKPGENSNNNNNDSNNNGNNDNNTSDNISNNNSNGSSNNEGSADQSQNETNSQPESESQITKEQITPKSSEDLETLNSEQEKEFIQNVISYFEEKEKENVIVIEESENVKDTDSTQDKNSSIIDSPNGKGKEIVTVKTVKTAISKLIEIKKVTKDIELELKQDLAFSVYVKDTEADFHFIKTQDQPLPSKRISRQQDDFIIEELFVRIENNSDEEQSADLDVKFIEAFEKAGNFVTKYWYILLLISLTVIILICLIIYLKCWKHAIRKQKRINLGSSETMEISKIGSQNEFLPTLENRGDRVFFQKKINNFAMLESKMHVSSIAYRE